MKTCEINDLVNIRPREKVLYFEGFLINECEMRENQSAIQVRLMAQTLFCSGRVELVQEKIRHGTKTSEPIFRYYAIGRKYITKKRSMNARLDSMLFEMGYLKKMAAQNESNY